MHEDETRTGGGIPAPDGPHGAGDEAMPTSVGRYRVVGKLGEGGMGVVYEAEQESPRRRVAVKVVRGTHAVDEQQVRMFEREAETLARLDHPDIASIHESGRTEDGRPFFAMELVRGRTLSEYFAARPQQRTDEEVRFRIALIAKIADAVHHAHQRGVIHRDLKPSNIIVVDEPDRSASGTITAIDSTSGSSVSGLPRVKILDFGLARITEGDVMATMTTEMGVIKGTLAYMSPEQASGHPEAIDVRTDVYALGVMLYEALAGVRPYDLAGLALAAAARAIEEQAPLPLRSRRDDLRRLDVDVVTIVARTLEKDPERRYGSAQEFAGDLGRYLTSQPILARPPSARYQLRKMIERNRMPTALLGLLLLAVIGFGVGMAALYARASAAEREASRQASTAEQALEFMTGMFRVVDPRQALGDVVTAREVLDNGARRIDRELAGEPEIRTSLQTAMGEVYAHLGLPEQAIPQLETAVEQRRELYGDGDLRTFHSVSVLADAWMVRGRADRTLELSRQALADRDPAAPVDETLQSTRRLLAYALRELGKHEEGLELLESTFEQSRAQLGEEHSETVTEMSDLASAYHLLGRFEEAEALGRAAVEIRRRNEGPDHPETLVAVSGLGWTLTSLDRFDEAEALIREAIDTATRVYGPVHPRTAAARQNLADLLRARGDVAGGMAELDRLIEDMEDVLPRGHPMRIRTLNNKAVYVQTLGRYEDARELVQSTLDECEEVLGRDHPLTQTLLGNQAMERLASGDAVEAERMLREVLDWTERHEGPRSPLAAVRLENLANAIFSQGGRVDEALELLERVRDIRTEVFGADHADPSRTRTNIATVYNSAGRHEEARAIFEEELEIQIAARGEGHIDLVNVLGALGSTYLDLKDPVKADESYDRALAIQRANLGEDDPLVIARLNRISELMRGYEHFERAEARAREALAAAVRASGPDDAEAMLSRYYLALALAGQGALEQAIAEAESLYEDAVRTKIDKYPFALGAANRLAEWTEQAGDAAAAAEWKRRAATHS